MEVLKFQTSKDVINSLREKEHDQHFISLLNASLAKAKSTATVNLDKALFNELSWPLNLAEYITFLLEFSMWTPQQSDLKAWKNPKTGNSREVYDRLCHFHFLIDQEVGEDNSTIVQNIPWFSKWLVDYANLWGSFLNTTASFSDKILESFIKNSPQYRIQDSMVNGRPNNPSGWLTFNQFFARELNPGLRPIDDPTNNKVITAPADCTFRKKYSIGADSTISEIVIKQTHTVGKIDQLLEGSKYANDFAGGLFVHYFLGPYSYHRFHTPVAGVIKECYPVKGLVSLDVNLEKMQFEAPDNSEDGYEFIQARGIIIIDTTTSPYGNMGIVAVIPVGMCQVSSVNMIAQTGSNVLKGEEFGYFLFGGSDIILLFQKDHIPQINECSNYRHYGTSISKCPPKVNS